MSAITLVMRTLQGKKAHGRFWWDDSLPEEAECLECEKGEGSEGKDVA